MCAKWRLKRLLSFCVRSGNTSPCWSLKALEELLPNGELIRPDSLLSPLFWHIFTLLLMFPVFMNLPLLLYFPVCVFCLPDVVWPAISVTLCVLRDWKKMQVEKSRVGMIVYFPCTCHMLGETRWTDRLNIHLKYCSTKGLISVCIQYMSWYLLFQKARGSFKITMICLQWQIWYLFSAWTCLSTGLFDIGSLVLWTSVEKHEVLLKRPKCMDVGQDIGRCTQ